MTFGVMVTGSSRGIKTAMKFAGEPPTDCATPRSLAISFPLTAGPPLGVASYSVAVPAHGGQ